MQPSNREALFSQRERERERERVRKKEREYCTQKFCQTALTMLQHNDNNGNNNDNNGNNNDNNGNDGWNGNTINKFVMTLARRMN